MANIANINPQQLQQLQQQAIVQQLQAPNEYGTEKLLINVNGQNSKIQSNKNSIVKYTLEQPVKLEIGDRVTLIESFVEERGLSIDTISFEEDVEEEIRFLYYIQGDCRNTQNGKGASPYNLTNCADQEFQVFPNVYPDYADPSTNIDTSVAFTFLESSIAFQNPYCFPNRNYTSHAANETILSENDVLDGQICGANGQYYYLVECFSPFNEDPSGNNPFQWTASNSKVKIKQLGQNANGVWFRPFYGSATIKIPAGNYSVSALSDLINTQLNGSAIANFPNIDKLQNKLYNQTNDIASSVTIPYFSNLNTKSTIDDITPDNIYNPDVDIIGADTHQPYQRRRGQMLAELYFNCKMTGNRLNFPIIRSVPLVVPSVVDESTIPVYANGTSIALNDGSGVLHSGKLPYIEGGFTTISQQLPYSPFLNATGEADRYLFRTNGTNFYLHLDAFKTIYGSDDYKGYYYNKDYTDNNTFANGEWSPHHFPNLQDIFAQNLGEKGKFYFQNNLVNYNVKNYPEEQSKDLTSRMYYTTKQDINDPKHLKFQCMFPVKSSGDSVDPTSDPSLAITNGTISQFAGTSSFELNYDTSSANRFSILNLHEPYKMASRTPDNKSDTNVGGQQATIFNTPTFLFNNQNVIDISQIKFPKCGIYPIDSVGGIAVNNFSFSTVKNTKVYKDLVSTIQSLNTSNGDYQMAREKAIFDLFSKPYEDFFESDTSAKQAWNSTLWSRLGFTYEQLGAVKNNLETIYTFSKAQSDTGNFYSAVTNPRYVKQLGIITHNAFDYTFIPSSSGLGTGNPYSNASASQNPQNYGLRAFTSGASTADIAAKTGFLQNYINILSNSRPINAFNFPSLNNGNNYLVIESDIVKTNAKDSNSNSTTIVGIMSKQNASNDTIYSVSPTTFIITEPKLLATIEVKIKNPDGTLVSDDVVGKNNGFVFQIERAIRVGEIAAMSF